MKFLKLSIVVLFAIALSSCGENVTKNCAQADWVGTYTGSIDCDGDVEDVTVSITASGTDAVVIQFVQGSAGSTLETTYDPITPDACELNESATESGLTITIAADVDKDGNLTLSETFSDGTDSSTCTITATKQ
ncbi:MAG: hypothetical protein KDE26_18325 [Bacteroidetes bacterium]|nr:hypothetical protein [Bacteroidota bacterium]